ncbi:ferredoxin Fer [Natronobeatus ordinarius]|uniref:ferredoxin Fer n=1 Tax=Natronobeatus ordinarius TaxID=2963433 RepID=UPI0020CE549A|nr:ferredoxin Fer [Natronobeatus ordinarius]
MYDTILIPTDGSDVAASAGEYAASLAGAFDADLHVLSVEEPRDRAEDEELPAEQAVGATSALADDAGLEPTTSVRETDGDVHREIIDYAEEHDVSCIVMGTHGRTGLSRFVLGSVAEQTLRESPIPVVTVHEGTDVEPTIDRLLVPTDGSDSAAAAVSHAIDLATATDATLEVVHVDGRRLQRDPDRYEFPGADEKTGVDAVDEAVERALEAGLEPVHATVLPGRADQAILAHAAKRDADAIVLGTHGRTGVRRYLLGSVTERVVRFAGVPVFAVKPEPGPTTTVEYLDYAVIEEREWSLEDGDLFERAAETAGLDEAAYGTLEVEQGEYLLDAAESAGLDWPFYCRSGGCVNCAAVCLEGEVEMDVNRSLSEEELEEGLRLTCVGTPTGDTLRLVVNAKELESLEDRVM